MAMLNNRMVIDRIQRMSSLLLSDDWICSKHRMSFGAIFPLIHPETTWPKRFQGSDLTQSRKRLDGDSHGIYRDLS